MFFFGWGKKTLTWSLLDGKQLLCRFEYFHIFLCPTVSHAKWYLIGDSRAADKEITYDDVKRLFPQNTPHIGHWQRYGLRYLGALIAVGFLYSWITGT